MTNWKKKNTGNWQFGKNTEKDYSEKESGKDKYEKGQAWKGTSENKNNVPELKIIFSKQAMNLFAKNKKTSRRKNNIFEANN